MCAAALSLFQTAGIWLDSLAYIESITDTYCQYFINDIQHTDNNSVKSVNYHLFLSLEQVIISFCMALSKLSDNFCRKNCLMTTLLMWYPFYLQEKQFPFTRNKKTYFHMHSSISQFIIPLCCRYQIIQFCTYKEYNKNIQFVLHSHITIQPLTPV